MCHGDRMASTLNLSAAAEQFLQERHLATLSTLRPDATLHVVPVGFTWENASMTVWIISSRNTTKVTNITAGSRACVCQMDGRRWLSLEGDAEVRGSAWVVRRAEDRYARHYQAPRANPERICIEIQVDRIMGSL
jgi:F420H(2)-dependent biliverdin reductase